MCSTTYAGSNVEDGHEMPALHADRMVREGEIMAVRRFSRACPGRLPLLVAMALSLAAPALADDAIPAVMASSAAALPVAIPSSAVPSSAVPASAVPASAVPIVAPAAGPAVPGSVATPPLVVVKPAPPVLPVAVPVVAPPEKAGDRADAIARDVVLHPPQKQMPEPAASSLRTVKLKLGGLLDRSVHGPEDTEVGHVIDVLLGEDGKPAALEMDVGGFMGVGNRKIVVAWALFDIPKPASTDPIRLSLTDAQVKSAPSAEESGEVTIVTGVIAHVPATAGVPPAKPDAPIASLPVPGGVPTALPPPAPPASPASLPPPAPVSVVPAPVAPVPVVQPPVATPSPVPAHPPGGQP